MKFESSMESLITIGRSESFADSLNSEFNKFGSAQFLGEFLLYYSFQVLEQWFFFLLSFLRFFFATK